MRKPSHVGCLEDQSPRQFACHCQVQQFGIGRPNIVIQSPRNLLHRVAEHASGRSGRKSSGRGRSEQDSVGAGSWNVVESSVAGSAIDSLNAGRVRDRGGEAKRAILIKCVDQRLSEMVIDDSESGPNR